MLVTEGKVEEILEYLSSSDDDYGRLMARVKGLEKDEKIILAKQTLEHRRFEKTMSESEAKARASREYAQWREDYENAVADHEIMRAHRDTQKIVWETWRTEQANLRRA